MKLSREASYFQTGNSSKSVSLTVGQLWTIQMTPIGPLEKMASTMRPRGTPSMRNRSVLWQKTSRMIGHPTWTKFGDKRARLSTSNALQPKQHAHKDTMESGTITSSLGLGSWLTSINLSTSTSGCLYFAYLSSIFFQSSFSSRTGKIRAPKLSKSKLASVSYSKADNPVVHSSHPFWRKKARS